MAKKIDMTGWYMPDHGVSNSRLTVIEEDKEYKKIHNLKSTYAYWKCRCDCGKVCIVSSHLLRNGDILSCGCLKKEVTSKLNKLDLTNQIFGLLTAIRPTDIRDSEGRIKWLCKCTCGNTVLVSSSLLMNKSTQSCGCLVSKGEMKIKQILQSNNIKFETHKYYNDLLSKTSTPLYYDFFIQDCVLLEYDGIQHFEQRLNFNQTQEEKNDSKLYDKMKDDYAISHNIPLKRIPYWDYNQITLENIMSDRWLINA